MADYEDDLYDDLDEPQITQEEWDAQYVLTGRGRGTKGNPSGMAMAFPRGGWNADTTTWRNTTARIIENAEKIAAHPEPPTDGLEWDELIKAYVELRGMLETVTREAIGLDLKYGMARVTQLARDVGLTQAHVSNQRKRWEEERQNDQDS